MGQRAVLTLSSRSIESQNLPDNPARMIVRVTKQEGRPRALRSREAFLARHADPPPGFGIYLALANNAETLDGLPFGTPAVILPDEFSYLADGDVLRVWTTGHGVRVLYRRSSLHNHFLLTERCNHYCLMCSQPPKRIDDSWIVDDVLAAIQLIDPCTREIGFTGGEPTLLGDEALQNSEGNEELLASHGGPHSLKRSAVCGAGIREAIL